MEIIGKAIEMILNKAKEEYGQDFKLEEGDTLTGVFNDGVVGVSLENGQIKINVSAGEPYKFDYNLNLLEEGGDSERD